MACCPCCRRHSRAGPRHRSCSGPRSRSVSDGIKPNSNSSVSSPPQPSCRLNPHGALRSWPEHPPQHSPAPPPSGRGACPRTHHAGLGHQHGHPPCTPAWPWWHRLHTLQLVGHPLQQHIRFTVLHPPSAQPSFTRSWRWSRAPATQFLHQHLAGDQHSSPHTIAISSPAAPLPTLTRPAPWPAPWMVTPTSPWRVSPSMPAWLARRAACGHRTSTRRRLRDGHEPLQQTAWHHSPSTGHIHKPYNTHQGPP